MGGGRVHTIRDSCFHRETGAKKTFRGGMAANTSKVR